MLSTSMIFQLSSFMYASQLEDESPLVRVADEKCLLGFQKIKYSIANEEKTVLLLLTFAVGENIHGNPLLLEILGFIDNYNPYDATILSELTNPDVQQLVETIGYKKIEGTDDYFKLTMENNHGKSQKSQDNHCRN